MSKFTGRDGLAQESLRIVQREFFAVLVWMVRGFC